MIDFPKRGQIYLITLPGQPNDRKARPALIVSLDTRNRLAEDVMVVPLTTTLKPSPTHVRMNQGVGGLKKNSMAKCEQLTTVNKAFLLQGPLAESVPDEILEAIEYAIMRAIGIII